MRIALIAAALAASTALAAPAFAQESDSDQSFTGAHAEGIVGWDRINDGTINGANGTDGVVYGGAIGYDYQIGQLVIGFEGEATGASTRQTATDVLAVGDSLRVRAGRDLYAGGRIGVAVSPSALIYVKGGYTNARVDTRYVLGTTVIEDNEDLDGWRAGAGAQVNLGRNLFVKGEYRYSKYSELNGTAIDLDRHQVVGGVGIRF